MLGGRGVGGVVGAWWGAWVWWLGLLGDNKKLLRDCPFLKRAVPFSQKGSRRSKFNWAQDGSKTSYCG